MAILAFICFYLFVRFLLPVFFPFILGYFLSKLVLPSVYFLNHKLGWHRNCANIVMVTLLVILLGFTSFFLCNTIANQAIGFIRHWSSYEMAFNEITKNCCGIVEDICGLNKGLVHNYILEFVFIRQIARNVVAAYFKTQLIIFGIISILCTIGFIILKNPYSILYGIIIGILDIIPLIVFVLCYLTREILEPKLMGGSMGIHPLISLLAIFAGYKLFGVFGMIIGPFGYVFITEILKAYDNSEKAPR